MQLQNVVGTALQNHMQVIWYNWIAILVLVFCYVICAIAGAANSASKTYSFVVIWTMLLLIAYAVGGTLIVRQPKYRSALSVGFLIGVSVLLINLLLITAAVSGGNYAALGGLGDPFSSTQAVTAFASLLLIALLFFTTFVTLFRDTLLPPPAMASTDQALPPPGGPQFGAAAPTTVYASGGASTYSGYGGGAGGSGDEAYVDKGYTSEAGGVPASGPGVI